MRTAFITSTGRTGTLFFTVLFNEHTRNAFSVHEAWPAFRRRSRQLLRRKPSVYEQYYFKLPRIYRIVRARKDWYVEPNFQLFAAIPLIRMTFPEALVIHVVRDGRDVVTSYLNRWRYIKSDPLTPTDCRDAEAAACWDGWNPLQKTAWYWKAVNQHAIKMKPDHVMTYESLFDAETRGILQLLRLLDGLEYEPADVVNALGHKVHQNPAEFFPPYAQWPELWKEQFWSIAGSTMKELGYPRME